MYRTLDRREFLKLAALAALPPGAAPAGFQDPPAGGRMIGTVPLTGLIGVADWDGIPVASLLERAGPTSASSRVLVSGIDDLTERPRTSVPGASWIFSRDDLDRAGAFLATRMNGAPLPRDHGSPVRL